MSAWTSQAHSFRILYHHPCHHQQQHLFYQKKRPQCHWSHQSSPWRLGEQKVGGDPGKQEGKRTGKVEIENKTSNNTMTCIQRNHPPNPPQVCVCFSVTVCISLCVQTAFLKPQGAMCVINCPLSLSLSRFFFFGGREGR